MNYNSKIDLNAYFDRKPVRFADTHIALQNKLENRVITLPEYLQIKRTLNKLSPQTKGTKKRYKSI